ncbi:hypothetical protein [Methylobacterium pseudosasicola]|uniref:Uncharacterized protein n=1 Tax=Methylobacterium pseudosasicola TaxID=582667 RepID=A0A1I4K3C2_9HYPH|nr:hypothetical protein [Methylobacterium pseudosasicola]SFL73013.1 hypothetical protein SAMN05192568_1009113 [Methylobacterium pseudosasicola]
MTTERPGNFITDHDRDETGHEAWFRRQVQIGLSSAKAGHLIGAAEVEVRFAAKRAATQRRLDTGPDAPGTSEA